MRAPAPDLLDVFDRVHIARNDVASGRALITENALGVGRLDAALDVLDGLLGDLKERGLPAGTSVAA